MSKPRPRAGFGLLLLILIPATLAAAPGDEPGPLLACLRAVGKEGAGNAAAQKAWRELVRRGPGVLPAVLAAWDGADPVAANWLRSAVDAIAERAVQPPAGPCPRTVWKRSSWTPGTRRPPGGWPTSG
jgi:hypothetical protein